MPNKNGAYREVVTTMLNDFSETNKEVSVRTVRSKVTGNLGYSPKIEDEGIVYYVEKYEPEYNVNARVYFSIEDLGQITVEEDYIKEGDNFINVIKIDIFVDKFI